MTTLDPKATVGRLVAEQPVRAQLFERLGIDYGRNGRVSLAQACSERGLDPGKVVRELRACDAQAREVETDDYLPATAGELADFIVATHHAYLRRELPRLARLVGLVIAEHSGRYPELYALRDAFADLKEGLEVHLGEQERVLFPMITRLSADLDHSGLSPVGSVADVLALIEQEFEEAGTALARIRALIDGLSPPPGPCPHYRALRGGLAELETDLRQHVHREMNMLLPAALAAELTRCEGVRRGLHFALLL